MSWELLQEETSLPNLPSLFTVPRIFPILILLPLPLPPSLPLLLSFLSSFVHSYNYNRRAQSTYRRSKSYTNTLSTCPLRPLSVDAILARTLRKAFNSTQYLHTYVRYTPKFCCFANNTLIYIHCVELLTPFDIGTYAKHTPSHTLTQLLIREHRPL